MALVIGVALIAAGAFKLSSQADECMERYCGGHDRVRDQPEEGR